MDDSERHALVQRLGQEMSAISEESYYAGWQGGTEYIVPELCRRAVKSGRTQYWGHGEITPKRAQSLIALAEQIGCWADTDYYSIGYDPFQPFPIPPELVNEFEQDFSSPIPPNRRQNPPSHDTT